MYCNNVLLVVPCIASTTSIPASQFTKTTTTTTTINNENTLPCFHWRKKVYTHEKHTNRQSKCTLKKSTTLRRRRPPTDIHKIYTACWSLDWKPWIIIYSLYKISAIYIHRIHTCLSYFSLVSPTKQTNLTKWWCWWYYFLLYDLSPCLLVLSPILALETLKTLLRNVTDRSDDPIHRKSFSRAKAY